MDININKMGIEKRLSDIGIIAKNFIVSNIEIESSAERLGGRNGYRDSGVTFGSRTITVPFYFKTIDLLDYMLIRHELYRLITDKNAFYIQEMRRSVYESYEFVSVTDKPKPKKDTHELSEIRYLVRLINMTDIEQTLKFGEGELVFNTIESPFGESVGTTLDPRTFNTEKWQVGQGLKAEDLSYAHSTNNFQIYNAGDVLIDPRQMSLKIKYQGASNDLKIRNNTTSDEWSYRGTSGANDTITLDGIRSLKNGHSIFGNTNKKLITIDKGFNDFSVTGTEGSFLISFEFRFYYL